MPEAPIKVLLIEDNPGDARLTSDNLEIRGGSRFQVVWQPTLATAVKKLPTEGVDVILLDVDLPDSWGLHGLALLRKKAPQTPVVIYTGLDDEEAADKARAAGASAYLCKWQVADDTLPRVLREVTRRDEEDPREAAGSVVGLLGVKGGVGLTTLAVNLAASLARRAPVTAIELAHGFGGFGACLRAPLNNDWSALAGLCPSTIDRRTVERCVTGTAHGFDVMLAPPAGEREVSLSADHLSVVTRRINETGAAALLDLGQCRTWTLDLLPYCGRLVLVTDRDATSVVAANGVMGVLRALGSVSHVQVAVVDRTPLAAGLYPEEVATTLGCKLAGSIPYSLESLAAAQSSGIPLRDLDPESRFSTAVDLLADHLVPEAQPRPAAA